MHTGGNSILEWPCRWKHGLHYVILKAKPAVLAGNKRVFEEKQTMKLTMLGTGNALVTECYNTCFVLSDGNDHFMVDGGGGMTVLHQLKYAGLDWRQMRTIFVTHKHIDHLLGIIWMMRMICQHMREGTYEARRPSTPTMRSLPCCGTLAGKLAAEKGAAVPGQPPAPHCGGRRGREDHPGPEDHVF